jgi:hypothetical protein
MTRRSDLQCKFDKLTKQPGQGNGEFYSAYSRDQRYSAAGARHGTLPRRRVSRDAIPLYTCAAPLNTHQLRHL